MGSTLFLLSLLTYASLGFAKIPNLTEVKALLNVYFPNLNENTTIYSFLSDVKNVELLLRVHQHSCIDMKRKRKIRSLDWFWNEFTLPVDATNLTFTPPQEYTLNDTDLEKLSEEGKFYNPYSPTVDNVTVPDDTDTAVTGTTKWPTNSFGDRVPKPKMKAMDYINMVNNDLENAKDDLGAGGCPLGFGRG
ncbi:uncharacterized protein LOC103514128 [Diaphorina citri]|uniref:Uncharacterized protein LOC103514128 n=1 Tax=Diaphorina citri TaxID=121845 RepID=A0A1S4EHB6_DIACI|nr:uncharacterized protein LOC103514128 [Diaphorina citri]XP_017301585.1 uncharacterized protein LOC103514128 [Diaphorina citri]XP_026682979.1 uncharacterized protein LOC103514128 [Diaphorina citri]